MFLAFRSLDPRAAGGPGRQGGEENSEAKETLLTTYPANGDCETEYMHGAKDGGGVLQTVPSFSMV